jgi:hypothetical protein
MGTWQPNRHPPGRLLLSITHRVGNRYPFGRLEVAQAAKVQVQKWQSISRQRGYSYLGLCSKALHAFDGTLLVGLRVLVGFGIIFMFILFI